MGSEATSMRPNEIYTSYMQTMTFPFSAKVKKKVSYSSLVSLC